MRTIYIAYCLLRELNHRLTGVSRTASLPTTAFVTGMLVAALHSVVAPLLRPLARLRPARPSLPEALTVLGTGRYVTSVVGGEALRETPHANLLIALGFFSPALEVIALPVSLVRAVGTGAARAWRWLTAAPARVR